MGRGILHSRWLPRPAAPDDGALVARAAEAACVSEFDLFTAAARAWYGAPPEEKALERLFVAHLFHRRVPAFARHFARNVLAAQAAGTFDAAEFGLDGLRRVQRPRQYVDPLANVVAYAVLALCLLAFI
jgi:hypothetical protein